MFCVQTVLIDPFAGVMQPSHHSSSRGSASSGIDRLLECAMQSSTRVPLSLPWEEPPLSLVFGNTEVLPAIPRVDRVGPRVDHAASVVAGECNVNPELSGENATYSHYMSVSCKPPDVRSKLEPRDELSLYVQRFEMSLACNYSASSLGRILCVHDRPKRLELVATALGGKALSTLKKRSAQVYSFVLWCRSNNYEAFPLKGDLVFAYLTHLEQRDRPMSRIQGAVECLNFMTHVLGVDSLDGALSSPLVQGLMRRNRVSRQPRRQARALAVAEVLVLEQFVCDDRMTAVDRVGVGSFLFALFARARLGDLRSVAKVTLDVSPDDPAWSNGFLDVVSLSHKTRAMSAALGLQLSLVAPSRGVSKVCWLKGFVNACEQALRPLLAIKHGSPLLCRPTGVGTWSEGPMRGDLVASWIRSILQAADPNMGSGITGHSAKATCLSWCAKANLGMDTRTILGHHSLGGRKSVATYSRDLQSGPLKELASLLECIREGHFKPDLTRSGFWTSHEGSSSFEVVRSSRDLQDSNSEERAWYERVHQGSDFASAVPPPECEEVFLDQQASPSSLHAADDGKEYPFPPCPPAMIQSEPACPLGLESLEQDFSQDAMVRAPDSEQGGVASSSSESSSDDSSSSPGGTEDEAVQGAGEHRQQVRARVDHNGCPLFRHSRTMTVHVAPLGNQWTKFLCGRPKTKDHQPCQSSITLSRWMCKQCSAGRPAQDISGLNEVLDRVLKRPRA